MGLDGAQWGNLWGKEWDWPRPGREDFPRMWGWAEIQGRRSSQGKESEGTLGQLAQGPISRACGLRQDADIWLQSKKGPEEF
jgi:hypothetical protein